MELAVSTANIQSVSELKKGFFPRTSPPRAHTAVWRSSRLSSNMAVRTFERDCDVIVKTIYSISGARLTSLAGYTLWPALILSYGTVGSAWRLPFYLQQ